MLISTKETSLVIQALNELGNLYHFFSTIPSRPPPNRSTHDGLANLSPKESKILATKSWMSALNLLYSGVRSASRGDDIDSSCQGRRWMEAIKSDPISSNILDRSGIFGCLLGGCIAAKISQFGASAVSGNTSWHLVSLYFWRALLHASTFHPVADITYATYQIKRRMLVPSVDLFTDIWRCDPNTFVSCLDYVSNKCQREGHNLRLLPILSIYRYMSTYVCTSHVHYNLQCRLLLVQSLTDLQLFSEATSELLKILHGQELPTSSGLADNKNMESRLPPVAFSNNKPVLDDGNLKALEILLIDRLPSNLTVLYGANLACRTALIHANLLIAVADTIGEITELSTDSTLGQFSRQRTFTSVKKTPKFNANVNARSARRRPPSADGANEKLDKIKLPPAPLPTAPGAGVKKQIKQTDKVKADKTDERNVFTRPGADTTESKVKGHLLMTSEQILMTLIDILLDEQTTANNNQYGPDGGGALDGTGSNEKQCQPAPARQTPVEIEVIVLSYLSLTKISLQRQHGSIAAHTVLQALKFLSNSALLKSTAKANMRQDNEQEPPSVPHPSAMLTVTSRSTEINEEMSNLQSLVRLDIRLWISCVLSLVQSLVSDIRAMGDIKGSKREVINEFADCRTYCTHGLSLAEKHHDIEMSMAFVYFTLQLNILEAKSITATVELVQSVLAALEEEAPVLSDFGARLFIDLNLMLVDYSLLAAAAPLDSGGSLPLTDTNSPVIGYTRVHDFIISKIREGGEKIEVIRDKPSFFSSVVLRHITPFSSSSLAGESRSSNLYSNYLIQLALTKLRLAALFYSTTNTTAITTSSSCSSINDDKPSSSTITPRLSQSHTASVADLKISRKMVMECLRITEHSKITFYSLLSDALYLLGHIEVELLSLGHAEKEAVWKTLMAALKLFINDLAFDTGKLKSLFLLLARYYVIVRESFCDAASVGKKDKQKQNEKKTKIPTATGEGGEVYDTLSCQALFLASEFSKIQVNRNAISGFEEVAHSNLGEKATNLVPEFAVLDLVGSYTLGEKKKQYKDAIEKELAGPLLDSLIEEVFDSYEKEIDKARAALGSSSSRGVGGVTWKDLLSYESFIRSMTSFSSIVDVDVGTVGTPSASRDVRQSFHLAASSNLRQFCRPIASSTFQLRTKILHDFLQTHLTAHQRSSSSHHLIQFQNHLQQIPFHLFPTFSNNLFYEMESPDDVKSGRHFSQEVVDLQQAFANLSLQKGNLIVTQWQQLHNLHHHPLDNGGHFGRALISLQEQVKIIDHIDFAQLKKIHEMLLKLRAKTGLSKEALSMASGEGRGSKNRKSTATSHVSLPPNQQLLNDFNEVWVACSKLLRPPVTPQTHLIQYQQPASNIELGELVAALVDLFDPFYGGRIDGNSKSSKHILPLLLCE